MLPLFPLGILILPKGKTRLRIFEPRYKRLVSLACQGNDFVVCLPLLDGRLSLVGTQVTIVDFEQSQDGLLEITVIGKQRVLLSQTEQQDDGLWFGETTPLENLSPSKLQTQYLELSTSLRKILSELELYSSQELDNVCDQTWMAQRWAELIPFSREIQMQILQQQNAASLNKLVLDLVTLHIGDKSIQIL